ncbi:hypothetical protein [Sphingomonas sp. LH128]|uniref:hypothetical protein n=1 Tax=Sphingomonas sp. LH128 TaxID=473781 RepID=UPI0002EEF9A4|nr:hypothetical protein [Sphingomonas sp. LH128]
MATVAPITARAPANMHSWLQRAFAHLVPAHELLPAAPSIETTIVDLRLILRRIEHARREHKKWDARYLAQTVARAIIGPLDGFDLTGDIDRLRHGAAFALQPIAAITSPEQRGTVDVGAELEKAAEFVRAAIADAEAERHGAR